MTDRPVAPAVQIAKFIYEMRFLKEVGRAGWSLVGISDSETVAEHCFRTASSDSSWHPRRVPVPTPAPVAPITTVAPPGRRLGQTSVVKSSGSRFSLNMVSAITAKGSLRFMVVQRPMNGERFLEFLKRLTHNAERPILLVLDGHPAHRAKIVSQFVESTHGRFRLLFLPGYSPDLNPDELVWKHVKQRHVGRQTVSDLADLTAKVMRCLRSLQKLPGLVRSFFRAPDVAYAAAR